MTWLERHLDVFSPADTVLYVGAGAGEELTALAAVTRGRLVALEPQPRLADALRCKAADLHQLEVLECALGDHTGNGTLRVFNIPEYSTMGSVEAVKALLPGLYEVAELSVPVRTLERLVSDLDLRPGAENWLIVDAPGLGAVVLSELKNRDLRQRFRHVVLRTERSDAAAAGDGEAALRSEFLAVGYRELGNRDHSDGDWPRVHFLHFDRSPKRRELEASVLALKDRARELVREKDALQGQLASAKRELEASLLALKDRARELVREKDALEGQLASAKRELVREKNALEGQLASAKRELEQATSQTQTIEALSSELNEKREEAVAIAEEMSDLRGRVEALESKLGEREQALQNQSEELESSQREASDQANQARYWEDRATTLETEKQEREAKWESDLAQLRADLSLSLRVKALREADLKELQERFEGLVAQKKQQHELLVQLSERLGAAAEYLGKIKGPEVPQDDPEVLEGLTEALSGDLVTHRKG